MKFRAKRLDNGELVEGYYVHLNDKGYNNHFILTGKSKLFWGSGSAAETFDKHDVDPTTLAMSTGVTDKNGVEIFGSVPVDDITMSKGADRLNCLSEDLIVMGNPDYLEFKKGVFYLRHRNIPITSWTDYQARDGEEWNGQFEITGKQYEHGSE